MARRFAPVRRAAVALCFLAAVAAAACSVSPAWKALTAPTGAEVLRFAVIGDSGTGGRQQYEVAARMARYRGGFPFELVLMCGDNMYGRETPDDFARKFERPYKPLLDAGVEFYAALGNHDQIDQRSYAPFNMGGRRYYTFTKKEVQFFALDSNYMDPVQLEWLERELQGSSAPWRIAFFHHPIYSSGRRHGAEKDLRALVEPLFVRYGVSVVFAGHEHLYERMRPQQGITYFTTGAAAKLSRGDLGRQPGAAKAQLAKGYDRDRHFFLAEIAGDVLSFQTISRTGAVVDQGNIQRRETPGVLQRLPLIGGAANPAPSPSARPSRARLPASRGR